jgi:hypothetical protein
MFIGSRYSLVEPDGSRSILGYNTIVIKDRVLSRTEERVLFTEPSDPPGGGTKTVTSYHYMLMCLVDGGDSAEIDEEELHCEVIAGLYEYSGSK